MSDRKGSSILLGIVLLVGTLLCLLFISTTRVSAIPAFARKYQTSCNTCHSNYPELNDFGEAFKKNGFKFPKDDETFAKEPPVMLGAKAQREAFPKALYPGEIPGTIPISLRYSGFAVYNSKQPRALAQSVVAGTPVGFLPRTDLFQPNTFTMIAAGSFGQSISFWVDDDVSTGGSGAAGGLGDGYLRVNDLGHYLHLPKDALNVRFGQFELDLPFTQARGINLSDYDIYDQASVAFVTPGGLIGTTKNPLVFGVPQRGFEFGGYPNDGNFAWSVAVVNGNNDGPAVRNYKDVYVRVSQRFNLERDPSVRKEVQAAGPSGPRDHTSLRLGAFYYYGRNALNMDGTLFTPQIGTVRDPFYRVGGDFRFKYRTFELYGLGMYGHDTNFLFDPETITLTKGTPITFTGGFVQGQYWFYPWLIGIMRYDLVNSPTDSHNAANPLFRRDTRNRISPGIQFLVRANIKWAFEYQHRWEQPFTDFNGTTKFFRPNGFVTGVDVVF